MTRLTANLELLGYFYELSRIRTKSQFKTFTNKEVKKKLKGSHDAIMPPQTASLAAYYTTFSRIRSTGQAESGMKENLTNYFSNFSADDASTMQEAACETSCRYSQRYACIMSLCHRVNASVSR